MKRIWAADKFTGIGCLVLSAMMVSATARSAPPTQVVTARRIPLDSIQVVSRERSIASMLGDFQSMLLDCNANGLPDSIDIADGTEVDLDHDGVIDDCELHAVPDTTWFHHSEQHPGQNYFATSFQIDGTVRIRFTVPHPGGSVRIDLLDGDGRRRLRALLKEGRQPQGHYEFFWRISDPRHKTLPPGRYLLRLRAPGGEALRLVRWSEDPSEGVVEPKR